MRELLFSLIQGKDFKLDYFSGTGAGGQHRNKHQNCVRIRHHASGVIVTGQSHRERKANEREALGNLVNHPEFKAWNIIKAHEIMSGEKIEDLVRKSMGPENLKVEIMKEGVWVVEK